MDDPESEWEIKVPSGANGGNGKLGLMLKLGRKILVTGIVITSAPFVLPPLMAISAIGLVCSVPFGIFLVSHSCTETIMSKLLPMPSPAAPLLLEYRKEFNGEEEEEEEEANGDENHGGQNEVIKGGFSIEREEEEWKEDTIEEVEMRIELVNKENVEHDKGYILQEGAYQEDEKKLMREVDEIEEENRYEEGVEFLDEEEERQFRSFEVEVKEIVESKEEQPIIEEIRSEQPAVEGQDVDAVVVDVEKHSSNIEKETPMNTENVEMEEELVRETRQNVENVDARRKPKKKAKSKTKGKGKQSVNTSASGQPVDEIHGSLSTSEGDKTERDNVNKQTTVELKKVAEVEKDALVIESKRSIERNRKKGRSRDAAEDKQSVEKAQADVKVKPLKGNEGTTERKPKQALIEESLGKQPVGEVTGVLGGLKGNENKESIMEETPLEVENVPVQLVQAIDVEENEKLLIAARGLTERIRDDSKTDRVVADKDRVNVGGVGKQPKEVAVKIEGTTEVKEEPYIGDGSMGEQSIEEVSNIVLEFEGDEKNGSNIEKETPFQSKKVGVQLSYSTDIDEDEELVRETRGLLEKIRDEGKTDYAVGDKWSRDATIDKDDKKTVGDVEEVKTSFLAHDRMEKPTGEFETELEENKAEYGNENNVDQNYLLNDVKKDVIFSNKDEQGLDLLESSSTVSQQGSPSDVNTFGGILLQ